MAKSSTHFDFLYLCLGFIALFVHCALSYGFVFLDFCTSFFFFITIPFVLFSPYLYSTSPSPNTLTHFKHDVARDVECRSLAADGFQYSIVLGAALSLGCC